jgi:hypothetical protein
MLRSLQIAFVEPWILMREVLQPAIQLADNVVLPLKKTCGWPKLTNRLTRGSTAFDMNSTPT